MCSSINASSSRCNSFVFSLDSGFIFWLLSGSDGSAYVRACASRRYLWEWRNPVSHLARDYIQGHARWSLSCVSDYPFLRRCTVTDFAGGGVDVVQSMESNVNCATGVCVQHVAGHYRSRSCTGRSSIPSITDEEATGPSIRYKDQS